MQPVRPEPQLPTANRERLRKLMRPHALALLNANDVLPTNADGTMPHVQNADLFYLTGIQQEETVLVLAPDAFDPSHREVLFLREPNAHLATWEGHKLSRTEATAISGIQNVRWLSEFPAVFRPLMCEMEHVYLNTNEHQRAGSEVETRDARFIRQVQGQYPLHRYHRLARLLHALRVVKSAAEVERIRHASALTAQGFRRVLRCVKPGVTEAELEAEFAHEFIRHRAGFAYPPIIAAGANNCVLHYHQNDQVCQRGELVLLDVAAAWGGYMSDCTRTVPVSGRFTRRQRQVYDAVLRILREMRAQLVPGKTTRDLRLACEALATRECLELGLLKPSQVRRQEPDRPAVRPFFMHGVAHPIGLDVHDVTYHHYLIQPGWVLTCEPALYLKEEGFGVRLENTVLVTEQGPVDLMETIPLEAEAIEAAMRGRKTRRR
jgi:Xaa-Pro aminopeptidase